MNKIKLTHKDFAKLFNDKISDYVKNKILGYKLAYSFLTQQEEEETIIKIIDTLLDPYLVYSGPHRLKQWENGWNENVELLNKEKSKNAISPHYFGKYSVNRLDQRLIKGVSSNYERNMLYVILDYLFDKHLRKVDNI